MTEQQGQPPVTSLPPYAEDAECLGKDVSLTYHRRDGYDRQPCKYKRDDLGGHLCRTCERCGYGWSEAPAYTNPATRPPAGITPPASPRHNEDRNAD
jgi:hypothetical protein